MTQPDRRHGERRMQHVHVAHERRAGERRQQQRRHNMRIPLELWVEEITHDQICSRHTGDISVGGVYFDQGSPHPIGTLLTLKFTLPGHREMIVARGEVVSGPREGCTAGMGIKFISFESAGLDHLQAYLGHCH